MKMKICFIISFLLLSLNSLCSTSSCVALNGGRGLFTDSTKTFSISAKAVEPDDQTVTIRMAARTAGWIAIVTPPITYYSVVGWIDNNGSPIVSQRNGSIFLRAQVKDSPASVIYPAPTSAFYSGYSDGVTCITFVRRLSAGAGMKAIVNATMDFNWVSSDSRPTSPNDSRSALSYQPGSRGRFRMNLIQDDEDSGLIRLVWLLPYPAVFYLAHGIVLTLTWFGVAVFGALVASYGRGLADEYWPSKHRNLMLLVTLSTAISIILIIWKSGPKSESSLHSKLGWSILGECFWQGFLGYFINPHRMAGNKSWYVRLYQFQGYCIILAAMVNCVFGLRDFNGGFGMDVWMSISAVVSLTIIFHFVSSYEFIQKQEGRERSS